MLQKSPRRGGRSSSSAGKAASPRRRLVSGALLGALLVPAAAVAAAPSAAAVSATLPPCRTADLRARLIPGSPGAGQRYAALVLTNRARHSCHTYGYVGMLFLDAGGRALPTQVVRDRFFAPHRVVLAPGAQADSQLHWTVVPGTGDSSGPCVTPPRKLEITPPDQYNHLVIGWNGGVVCQRGQIDTTRLVHAG